MKESGYYPPGAEFDRNAPYNQHDPEIMCEVKEITYDFVNGQVTIKCDWTIDGKSWSFYDMDKYDLKDEYVLDLDEVQEIDREKLEILLEERI